MTSNKKRSLSLIGRVLVSAVVLGWLIWRTEWTPILETLAGVRLPFWFAALGLYCLAQVVSSYRWQMLARSLGFREKLRRFVALYYVGMFFNLFLPTSMGGDVVRAWFLAGGPGRRWLAALSVLSERTVGLIALLCIACLATLANLKELPVWALGTVWATAGAAIVVLVTLPVLGRWSTKCRSLAQGLSLARSAGPRWAAAFGLSLIVQVAGIVQIGLLGLALDLPAPALAYAVVIPLVTLLTMLPISVNGVGVREGSLVLLLAPVGVSEAGAVALGIVWFAMLAAASVLGGVVYLFGRFSRKEWDDDGSLSRGTDQGRAGQPPAIARAAAPGAGAARAAL